MKLRAQPTPITNVINNTPNKRNNELKIYSNKKVSFIIEKYSPVGLKKLLNTVKIGIATIIEINKEVKNQILIL